MSDINFDGLDEAEQALTNMISRDFPEEFENLVYQIASELQGAVKGYTPVDTSWLRDNWFIGEIVRKGNEYFIEVYNNIEYVDPVEYGHRKKGDGLAKGAHMMELSLAIVNARLSSFMQDWLSDFLDTHEVF